ncbi:MAG: RdgB/HAM1 family non-canonical purine NTP pyrophosphatase [Gammaproteobacteria bacterium]|nr:RdgB/HAM1 family non-canonical purine NTP pyrophosphatase [Gammaproteobacteria bacterium]
MQKVVMASGNAGKIREIARLLGGLGVEVVAQSELGVSDADETGTTFAANSLIKAQHAADATGLPAIADDSGLSVDALDGAPGVYSARYAGRAGDEANNDKLLAALDGIEDRGAAFHCVATFIDPRAPEPLVAAGEWRGEILHARQGDGGFGYDPLFFVPDCNCSSAELSPEQKNARSHRGQALHKLVELIKQKYA